MISGFSPSDSAVLDAYPMLRHAVARVPPTTKRDLRLIWRFLTSPLRALPEVFIIGAQKSGTTTLYEYLLQHPSISRSLFKEPKYFDLFSHKSKAWLRVNFEFRKADKISVDATPDYMIYPSVPEKLKVMIPQARFVVLLREPISRSISHYNYSLRRGYEDLSLEDALLVEDERLSEPFGGAGVNLSFRENSYVLRSKYADHLSRWFACFPRDHFLVLSTRELEEDPQNVVDKVSNFLGLNKFPVCEISRQNAAPSKSAVSVAAQNILSERLNDQKAAVESLLGEVINW